MGATPRTAARSLPTLTALALIAIPFLTRLWLLRSRGFNPDEFQHLHSAWCISQGMLPYLDYFEHHTPWLHFFLAGFFPFFDVETRIPDAIRFIFFARGWMWLFTAMILVLTFWLAKVWRDPRGAWLGTLLLSNTVMFWSKTLEIRPDVPSTVFLLAAILMMIHALRGQNRSTSWRFVLSGAFLGAGVMCTQKLLFAVPGLGAALLWYWLDPRQPGRGPAKLGNTIRFGLGFAAPILFTLGYFAWRGGFSEFIELNFLLNLGWKAQLSPVGVVEELARQNPFLIALGVAGLLTTALQMFREEPFRRGDLVIVLSSVSLLGGLFIIPVPHRQYALMFLPLLAILAGNALVEVVDRLSGSRMGRRFGWSGTHGIIAILMMVLSVYPFYQIRSHFERGNLGTLQNIRYVLQNTTPTETVLDGFTGLGVFRPHAFFYFFLHDEIRAMLTQENWDELLDGLRLGSIHPKLVFFDRNLRETPSEISGFIERNYDPIGHQPIRALVSDDHRGLWTDEGIRSLAGVYGSGSPLAPPYVLVEEGWHDPEIEDGIAFRPSRGRHSRLQVPIRTAADYLATVRVRLEYTDAPVSMKLTVNGNETGEAPCTPGWREYSFSVPTHLLESGFNEFVLSYSTTPRRANSDYHGRNTVVSVEYLELIREEP